MRRYQSLGKKNNRQAMEEASKQWNRIAKPLHGLGKLEDTIIKIAGIQENAHVQLKRRAVLVFCSDNGITAQGVTQTDSSVTAIVAENIADGKASINQMCKQCNTDVVAIDIGIVHETSNLKLKKQVVRRGTYDFSERPAMSIDEAIKAIETGISLVKEYKELGYDLLATGEMGIGNTTTSSAVACSILGLNPNQVVGRGAGLSEEGLRRKKEVICNALNKYDLQNKEALEILATVGGFDLAGMAGVYIGGAIYGMPVIIDGMISAVAALIANELCSNAKECMIASHISREPCMLAVMNYLELSPIIDGDLALGEGTGAALLFPMLDMAYGVYTNDETFQKMNIDSYQEFEEK